MDQACQTEMNKIKKLICTHSSESHRAHFLIMVPLIFPASGETGSGGGPEILLSDTPWLFQLKFAIWAETVANWPRYLAPKFELSGPLASIYDDKVASFSHNEKMR